MDQSDDERTAYALRGLLSNESVRYLRSRVKGKGIALNLGLDASRSEIIACTDDDCVVPPNWLERMAAAFDGQPRMAAVFGKVDEAAHDAALGFVPAYRPKGRRLLTSVFQKPSMRGMGACMGVRRSAILALGGFDPAFGPGGIFPSADDWEIAVRALLGGFVICETDGVSVVHHGFRTYREGRALARRDWYAIGAMYAKPLRTGHWPIIVVALNEFLVYGIWPPLGQLLRLQRPVGFGRSVAFVQGFIRGLRRPEERTCSRSSTAPS